MLKEYKKFIAPVLLAFFISSVYIIFSPGEVKSDAAEYDGLANSILKREYSLNGNPSMEREPGYPFFRAVIKTVTLNNSSILWVQAILYTLLVFFVGLTTYKIDPQIGSFGAWGATLAYGLAFYPSVHISEVLTAFLLTLVGLFFILSIEKPTTKNFVIIGILGGILILTRYTYILVPMVCLIILSIISIKNNQDKKTVIKKLLISFAIIFSIVFPWVLRNYIIFKEVNVAGRSGAILYARAWRADKSWKSLGESYLSVALGRGLLFTVYSNNQSIWLEQWGGWWRDPEEIKLWGDSMSEIDQNRKKAALDIIFKDFNNFSKFVVWTGVDELRLLELPNPIFESRGSPFEGTYGPLAKEGKLSGIQIAGLFIVHLIQLLWFMGVFVATYLGFKKYGYKFVPGIFLICILLPHSIADNIARYGAPLQPWLLSGIFMTIIFPIYLKIKANNKAVKP